MDPSRVLHAAMATLVAGLHRLTGSVRHDISGDGNQLTMARLILAK
jgi:hypothetical protein